MTPFFRIATQRDVVVRALKTSLLVGVCLVLINQADALIRGDVDPALIIKVLLTFAVPYGVSTYSSVSALRSMEE